ncbi:MAG: LysE family translocator [Beutenbergiaceae bacterium]
MPTWQAIATFTAAAAVLIAIPGPNHLYIMTRSLAQGRQAGIASSFGVETGTLVHLVLAAAGLSYLIAASQLAFTVVKYAGAAYLIYLGIKALRSKALTLPDPTATTHVRGAYWQGALVNFLNPKVIIFFVAFLPLFLDPSRWIPGQIAVLGLIMITLGLASNLVYAIGAHAIATRLRRGGSSNVWTQWLAGIVYIGLGIATAFVANPAPAP